MDTKSDYTNMDRVALLSASGEYGGGRGDGLVVLQPLFKFDSTNPAIDEILKKLTGRFGEYRVVVASEIGPRNSNLVSGLPSVVTGDIDDIRKAVTESHSTEFANFVSNALEVWKEIEEEGKDIPDNYHVVEYPGQFYY